MAPENGTGAHTILFGMSRAEDERSLAAFLRLFSRDRLTDILIPRMSDAEIEQIVHLLTTIMRKRLSEKEYHTFFLGNGTTGH